MTAAANPGPPEASVVTEAYRTGLGTMYQSTVEAFLDAHGDAYAGKVSLVFFSPPFPLNRKKKYGNLTGSEYLTWLGDLAPRLAKLLTKDGSLVVEVGNSWDAGSPTMSLLPLKALMAIAEKGDLKVCQQFICHNPARLPTPAQWVTIERIRVKDSYTHVWWMSRVDKPKASNRKVLAPYSRAMEKLLERGTYNWGKRDSGYDIGEKSFLTDNGGAIPGSVFSIANTRSDDPYRAYCREKNLKPHPAQMPGKLAEWFITFLTDEGDLVLDPFGGSNTTGAAAETLKRRWISIEPQSDYVEGSMGRFESLRTVASDAKRPRPRS